jgi:hypothetical protein
MRTGLDFKSAQFDQVRRKVEDLKSSPVQIGGFEMTSHTNKSLLNSFRSSPRAESILNKFFQSCWQLGTSSANTTCWRLVGRLATRYEIFTCVHEAGFRLTREITKSWFSRMTFSILGGPFCSAEMILNHHLTHNCSTYLRNDSNHLKHKAIIARDGIILFSYTYSHLTASKFVNIVKRVLARSTIHSSDIVLSLRTAWPSFCIKWYTNVFIITRSISVRMITGSTAAAFFDVM